MITENETSSFTMRPSPQWRRFHIMGFVFFLFFLAFFLYSWITVQAQFSRGAFFQTCYFPFFVFFCLLVLVQEAYQVWFARLVITANGLEYHAFGGSISAAWADLEKIGVNRLLFYKFEGLYLNPNVVVKEWVKIPIMGKRTFIPLSIFAPAWKDSQLGDILFHRAPHLFSGMDEPEKPAG